MASNDDAIIPPPPEGFEPEQQQQQQPATAASPMVAYTQPPAPPPGFEPEQSTPPPPPPGFQPEHEVYGTDEQKTIAKAEAFGRGAVGFLAPMAERALGVSPESIEGRKNVLETEDPWVAGGYEAAGFGASMMTPLGVAGALAKAGDVALHGAQAAGLLSKIGEGSTLAARMANGATRMAAEMALFSANDEATKYILNVPDSVGTAASNIGLNAILGGIGGGALSGFGHGLNKLAAASGLKDGMQKWADTWAMRSSGISPVDAIHTELDNVIGSVNDLRASTWGNADIKQQALSQVLPQMNETIQQHSQDIISKINQGIETLTKTGAPESQINSLKRDLAEYSNKIAKPDVTSLDVFNAEDDLKGSLQGYVPKGGWGATEIVKGHPRYDLIQTAKNLSREVRVGLENPEVWGKAGELQSGLNSAFNQFKPALDDIDKKFFSDLNGQRVVDPKKVQTLVNEAGKDTPIQIRQQMVGNLVEKYPQFKGAVDKLYESAGIENPHNMPSLTALEDITQKTNPWVKAANHFYDSTMSQIGAQTAGAVAGAYIGDKSNIPGMGAAGAVIGSKMAAKALPALIQPLMRKAMDIVGVKTALNFGEASLKGKSSIATAAKNLFNSGSGAYVLNKMNHPSRDEIDKLDVKVSEYSKDPSKFDNITKNLSYYAPDHAAAMQQLSKNAIQYLNNLKPQDESPQSAIFDTKHPPTEAQMAPYRRALGIAENPLSITQYMKDGSMQAQDVHTLQATNPAVYNQMKSEIYQEVANASINHTVVPYRLKQAASIFLGMPLDSTMTPANIQAAQPIPQSSPPQSNTKPNGQTKHGTSSLGKNNKSYMTPNQNAESDRSERH